MNRKKEKGMSILEAIVASVIVGIGFIGIFQIFDAICIVLFFSKSAGAWIASLTLH